jgi:hypothetical protein
MAHAVKYKILSSSVYSKLLVISLQMAGLGEEQAAEILEVKC